MRGLRTHEDKAFQAYFQFVQRAAAERGCVFFLDCGEGRELITEDYEGEDLSGWLVPLDKADGLLL